MKHADAKTFRISNAAQLRENRIQIAESLREQLVELNARRITTIAAVADIIALAALFFVASLFYRGIILETHISHGTYGLASVALALLSVGLTLINEGYSLRSIEKFTIAVRRAFNGFTIAFAIFVCLMFMVRAADEYSRGIFVIQYVVGMGWLMLARFQMAGLLRRAMKVGLVKARRVVLVGTDDAIVDYMREFQPWNDGVTLVGVFRVPDSLLATQPEADLTALTRDIEQSVRATAPDDLVLILPWTAHGAIEALCRTLSVIPVSVHLAPSRLLQWFQEPVIANVGSTTTLRLMRAPLTDADRVIKRMSDFTGALLLLLLLAPLMALVAAAIKLDSRGPVIFRQQRHGFNQKPFRVFKFRTMTTLDDGDQIRQATRADKRITRVGRFLRATNLDELPQLLNVLRGEMSLVGPRPHALAHNREFEEKIALYARRHNVMPGITGWAQVNGLRGETDTPDKMQKRVECDLYYIDNWSIWLDMRILFLTIFSRKAYRNAY